MPAIERNAFNDSFREIAARQTAADCCMQSGLRKVHSEAALFCVAGPLFEISKKNVFGQSRLEELGK
jgi:hypothetical protein